MTDSKKTGLPFDVDVDEDIALGVYSNTFIINQTDQDFILDFAFRAPGLERAKIVSRVVVTPTHMKRLAYLMMESVKKYEERFGEIDINTKPKTPVN